MKSEIAAFTTSPPSAAYYRGIMRTPIKWIVIHTAEGPEGVGAAKQVAKWSAQERFLPNGQPNHTSWHYAVDCQEVANCLDENFAGNHTATGKIDYQAIAIELCLHAAGDWTSKLYLDTVDLAAKLTAERCAAHKIPLKILTLAELKLGESGIISHNLVRLTGWSKTTHTDPGPKFPWDFLASRIGYWSKPPAFTPKPTPPVATPAPDLWTSPLPVLKLGASGSNVKDVQAFFDLKTDGVFGVVTDAAIRRWQVNCKTTVDGIVGPKTWLTLLPTVGKDDRGGAVKIVQRRLGLVTDGIYGQKTAEAIRRFQSVSHLAVDDIVGKQTWLKLLLK